MTPDPEKNQAVKDWPMPEVTTEVLQFVGLASYYRRYIRDFADITAPLYTLTQKGAVFSWTAECADAFATLKDHLQNSPLLAYPCFDNKAGEFKVHKYACAVGVGMVLEQDDHVISYAS